MKGLLYGTTINGGSGCSGLGCGAVYSITTTGTETVLHIFAGTTDGEDPEAGLTVVNGTLYGTTYDGGDLRHEKHYCCGTVFALTP